MRELKFRVYDTVTRKMLGFGEVRHWSLKSLEDEQFANVNIIQQYTGLKDKNAVEIYEGDIVGYANGSTELVEYKEWCIEGPEERDCGTDYIGFNPEMGLCEVIGNMYENPELLEGLDAN